MDVNDDSVFTPEERSEIRKMIKQQSEINPVTLETRDQLPLGLMSYGFQATQLVEYDLGPDYGAAHTFNVKHGRNVYLWFSGTGYTTTGNAIIGVNIYIDGALRVASVIFANPANTHLAFAPTLRKVEGLSIGPHTITFALVSGTTVDNNDVIEMSIFELP